MIDLETTLVLSAILIGLAALAFWGWMAFHCLKSDRLARGERVPWFLAILFGKLVGAGAYYFLRYRRREPLPGTG